MLRVEERQNYLKFFLVISAVFWKGSSYEYTTYSYAAPSVTALVLRTCSHRGVSGRGAICASVLVSELPDTLLLDYLSKRTPLFTQKFRKNPPFSRKLVVGYYDFDVKNDETTSKKSRLMTLG